jgi:uncharacterized MAPEG superfamily protein
MASTGDSPASGGPDWRAQRRTGMIAIAASMAIAAGLWFGIRHFAPIEPGMEDMSARMLFALKCTCFATLFCLVTGIEAVAHERLRSPAFDPLAAHETRRMRVNQRYLQNTLEQLAVFVPGLFGLAAYSQGGDSMRAVLASATVWILSRLAFWIGYHRSAAMRGIGAPGMVLGLLMLLYVAGRIGFDTAGSPGAIAVVAAFLLFEALLFRTTRALAG